MGDWPLPRNMLKGHRQLRSSSGALMGRDGAWAFFRLILNLSGPGLLETSQLEPLLLIPRLCPDILPPLTQRLALGILGKPGPFCSTGVPPWASHVATQLLLLLQV